MMKKTKLVLIVMLFLSSQITNIYALEDNQYELNKVLEELNKEYGLDLHILNEEEYYSQMYLESKKMSYAQYLDMIEKSEPNEVKDFFELLIHAADEMDVSIEEIETRSVVATKAVNFNNNINRMTLRYKYITKSSSKYFDTSYKPSVTVVNLLSNNYFIMSSYTGSFKNSNKTYSVIAKGNLKTYYGLLKRNFTINFNI